MRKGRRLGPFVPMTVTLLALSFLIGGSAHGASDEGIVFLPIAARTEAACDVRGTQYGTLPIASEPTDIPAVSHPDINLAVRGFSKTTANLDLVLYGGPTDSRAPQFDALFAPDRLPRFSSAYRVNHWDWSCNCRGGPITDWDVTLLGMATTPGEQIRVPDSGYEIGAGFEVLVLYAAENRITLKYTPDDNVVSGYTIHVEDVCVEEDLLALYREMNAAGRHRLPALHGRQPFGRAQGAQIRVAIRDNGSFLDPRSQKDWWKEYPAP